MDMDSNGDVSPSPSLSDAKPLKIPDDAIDLFPGNMGPKIFLLPTENRILKAGFSVKLSEAEAMRFVADNTSVPVPVVYDAYEDEGNGYIFMSRVPGELLGKSWDRLCTEQKASVVRQLSSHIAEMETLSGDFYGALWNMPSEDIFFKHFPFVNEKIEYGPYFSRREYNAGLVAALANSRPGRSLSDSDRALAERVAQCNDEIRVFSHGDLHRSNILVDSTGRITGIIDWEGAGFSVPGRDYFEARSRSRNNEWTEALDRVFPKDSQVDYELMKELDQALKAYTGI